MKYLLGLLVVLFLADSVPALADDDFVFRHLKWGMTVEECIRADQAIGDLPPPMVNYDLADWPEVRYLAPGGEGDTANQLRVEYFFYTDKSSPPPIARLNSTYAVVVLHKPSISGEEAEVFSKLIGLPLPACDNLQDCHLKIKNMLVTRYGQPSDSNDMRDNWRNLPEFDLGLEKFLKTIGAPPDEDGPGCEDREYDLIRISYYTKSSKEAQ